MQFYDGVSWFSVRYIIFTAGNVNIDRERRNTHFPIYVAVITALNIRLAPDGACSRAEDFVFKHMSLRVGETVPSRPVLVWQQLFERLTSILKYVLDRYCRLPWELSRAPRARHKCALSVIEYRRSACSNSDIIMSFEISLLPHLAKAFPIISKFESLQDKILILL